MSGGTARGWGRFAALWAPQTLAITGRGLLTFALGVWVYERTHSATLFALLEVSTILPGILAAPLVGWAVDRLGARRAMLLADAAAVLVVCAVQLAFYKDAASPAVLYVILLVGAVLTCLQWPAYTALVTLVAPEAHLARAAALMQVGYTGQQVVAPAVAGALLGVIGVDGVVGVSLVLSAIALGSLLLLDISAPAIENAEVWRDIRDAWTIIDERGLFRVAVYIFASYLPGGFVIALATPLVLTIAGPQALGMVMAVMGTGMLAGSVTASGLARAERSVTRLLRYDTMLVVAMLGAGLATTAPRVAVLGFVFLFGIAGMMAEEQAVWQTRIPVAAQGRVFALRRAITWASLPISYALAGPLADHVFTPVFGARRGMALLLICAGAAKGIVVLSGMRDRRLRRLDALTAPAVTG